MVANFGLMEQKLRIRLLIVVTCQGKDKKSYVAFINFICNSKVEYLHN